ncbi:hypothetical protein BJ912DRAFT_930371 [Pholiota molesta]|nr:hypothetical protein BJ912DRAFT_930371 [Pholiota molesta]
MTTEEPIPILSQIPQMSVNSIPCGDIEFYPDAEDFTITDGEFNTVRGSVYIGPALREAPQQKSSHSTGRVTYFPRAKGFIILGGNFMTIGGNLYDTRPPKIPPTSASEVPRRDVHNTNRNVERNNQAPIIGAGKNKHTMPSPSRAASRKMTQQWTGQQKNNMIASDVNDMTACDSSAPGEFHCQNTVETNPFQCQADDIRRSNPFLSQMPQPITFSVADAETPRQPLYESPTSENAWNGSHYAQSTPPVATYK